MSNGSLIGKKTQEEFMALNDDMRWWVLYEAAHAAATQPEKCEKRFVLRSDLCWLRRIMVACAMTTAICLGYLSLDKLSAILLRMAG